MADTRSRRREHGARGIPATHRLAHSTLHNSNNMSRVKYRDDGIRGGDMHSTCSGFTTSEASERSSERTTEGRRNGLPGEAGEGGGRPGDLGGEGGGQRLARLASHEVQQSLALRANGAKGGDNKGDTAKAAVGGGGGRGTEVLTEGTGGDGRVGGEAGGGGVEAGEGGRASNIRGLDILH